ncbi:MAG: tRNA (adenosine(37)-N6)-threonylcarbamoyltransferase complex transferase subunit TsaD [Candidatus Omnitrophica bacterium]|nr:tRNA (adenosine(37)-N6)-threonylcarbamoyltransferase complex transferase subunit TsaD [Candidatus Omnitrophota bacterium]
MRILAIESSCDETAVAILESPSTVRVSLVSSQVALHRPFGGVVPEVASRAHQEWLPLLVKQALAETDSGPEDIDLIVSTRGPGLIGALLVGVSFSRSLAMAWGKPWMGINHLEGHLASLDLCEPSFHPPYVALLVSGGHTEYVHVDTDREVRYLGGTLDDAAGEAFDKVAQLLALGYPGGPAIQKAAEGYEGDLYPFPIPMKGKPTCDISFSGLKTAVAVALEKEGIAESGVGSKEYWAASFQETVVEALLQKLELAAEQVNESRIALVGGVAANRALREGAQRLADRRGLDLGVVPLKYCGDNAAMIAAAAVWRIEKSGLQSESLDADPNLFFQTV